MRGPVVRTADYIDRKRGVSNTGLEQDIFHASPREAAAVRSMLSLQGTTGIVGSILLLSGELKFRGLELGTHDNVLRFTELAINSGLRAPMAIGGLLMAGMAVEAAVNLPQVGKAYVAPETHGPEVDPQL